jgi:hypothetical protein
MSIDAPLSESFNIVRRKRPVELCFVRESRNRYSQAELSLELARGADIHFRNGQRARDNALRQDRSSLLAQLATGGAKKRHVER